MIVPEEIICISRLVLNSYTMCWLILKWIQEINTFKRFNQSCKYIDNLIFVNKLWNVLFDNKPITIRNKMLQELVEF